MNKSYKLIGVLPIFLLVIIFISVIPSVSSDSGVINTFLNYGDAPTATSKTVTQGDYVNLILIAYSHREALQYEKLELVSPATLIFQENLAGDHIETYTWLYTKSPYVLNTGILTPGTYTLRFTAKTKVTQSVEYSDLRLIILPKVVPPVCGNGKLEGTEQCDQGSLNGQVCSPLYGSSCTYCSSSCKLVTVNGPFCGDGTCSNGETCSTCPGDCGICPVVCDLTNAHWSVSSTLTGQVVSLIVQGSNCNGKTIDFAVYQDKPLGDVYVTNTATAIFSGSNSVSSNWVAIAPLNGDTTPTYYFIAKVMGSSESATSGYLDVTIPPRCGDGQCNGAETCSTCSTDCGVCPPRCGDGQCNGAETCSTCSADCGICAPVCGNGKLEGTEQCDDGNKLNGDGCSSTCQIEVQKECMFQLTKSVDKTNVQPGDIVTFTLKYKNIGDGTCTGGGVKIQEILNSNLDYLGNYTKTLTGDSDGQSLSFGWQTTSGYDEATNTLIWNAHVVSPGEEGTIKFEVKVLQPEQCGDFNINNYFKSWSNEKGWQNSNTITLLVDNDCYSPVCGNGVKDTGEQCDDGNKLNNDGCSSTCKLEVCGDSIKQTNEQCDYGTSNGQVCSPLYGSSCTYCSSSCKLISLTGPYCGDGIKQTSEQCDDGNKVSGDGCSSTCQTEVKKECILQITKTVDKTNVKPGDIVTFTLKYKNIGNGSCTGGGVKIQDILSSNLVFRSYTKILTGDSDSQSLYYGYYEIPGLNEETNTLTWNAHVVSPGEEGTIKFEVKVLQPSQCGDFQMYNVFKIWSNEKGWQTSNTVNVYVDNDCYFPGCGNGVKDTGEQCDDGNLLDNDGCSSTCKIEFCGDCIKQTNEQCDDGNTVNGDGCSSKCKLEVCGDGICNNHETCSTCSQDCGTCPEKNCTTCKDSKPLDDSDYDYYYLEYINSKPTVISGETIATDVKLDLEKSVLEGKFPLIALILIVGVLILLILAIIIKLIKR